MAIIKEINKTGMLIILGIFLIGIASAANVCCERTLSGHWCQDINTPAGTDVSAVCNVGNNPITGQPYRAIFSFCDATSYCNLGTCVNNQEGTCMPNSPQILCEAEGGAWIDKPKNQIPQCSLGCCLIGSQAAFVTQVSCNRLASLYGLPIEYRADINDEVSCIASANPTNEGACVYAKESINTCERTTRKACQDKEKSMPGNVEFYDNYLCSANELETICARSQNTIINGDDIYFVDTCGNIANIYDASKVNDENYWSFIQNPTCGDEAGNKDSATCGDCDYLEGSMARQIQIGETVSYGNYICGDLDCLEWTGPYPGTGHPKHGETWCATASGTNEANLNLPGDSHYRFVCYNGEVNSELCDPTRQKICDQTVIGRTATGEDFYAGNCKINIWQDCSAQNTSEQCNDDTKRDCRWVESSYQFSEKGLAKGGNGGICVPDYLPGFARDGAENVIGGEFCNQASAVCYVKLERKVGGITDWDCSGSENNCSCIEDSGGRIDGGASWASQMNGFCTMLGDCGNKNNFDGRPGESLGEVVKLFDLEKNETITTEDLD